MSFRSIFILVLLAGCSLQASAQRKKPARKKAAATKPAAKTPAAKTNLKSSARDSVKTATIEIMQSYKPELRQAPKPVVDPALPIADTARPALTYEVPQQSLMYTYNSFPLRPLALGKDTVAQMFPDYVQVGGGNLSTFMLDAGISRFKGEDYETALRIHHLSRSGRNYAQQAMSTGLRATGTWRKDGMIHNGFFDLNRTQYHYYGYDNSRFAYDKADIRQRFMDLSFGAGTQNEGEGYMGLNYKPSLAVNLFGDRFDAAEQGFDLRVPVSYDLDTNITLNMGVNFLYTRFANNAVDISTHNNIFQLTPGVHFRNELIKGYAGLYPTFGKGGIAYILPDLRVNLMIPNTQVNFTAGYHSTLTQNTYKQLSMKNPFMFNNYNIRQTRINELYASGETNIGTHIYAEAKLAWKQYGNLPLFVNDLNDGKNFNIIYDHVNAFVLEGAVRYQIANTFVIGLSPSFYNFYKKTYTHVWHEPSIRVKGDLLLRPLKELTVTAYLSYMDGLYAAKTGGITEKLNPVIDLGGGATYDITNRIAAFAQVNNLLNRRYERWYQYETFGFNLFGGIRLKF